MNVFSVEKQHANGQTYFFHRIKEPIIDLSTNAIDAVIKSWVNEEDAISNNENCGIFIARVSHAYWNQSHLETLEQDVLGVEWVSQGAGVTNTPQVTLESAKQSKTKYINTQRDLLEKDGFPYMDKIIQSDVVSSIRISVATQSAQVALQFNQPFSIDWATKDNSILTLDAMGMIGMSLAIAQYANTLHLHARDKKALIDEAKTIEEVEAIVW